MVIMASGNTYYGYRTRIPTVDDAIEGCLTLAGTPLVLGYVSILGTADTDPQPPVFVRQNPPFSAMRG